MELRYGVVGNFEHRTNRTTQRNLSISIKDILYFLSLFALSHVCPFKIAVVTIWSFTIGKDTLFIIQSYSTFTKLDHYWHICNLHFFASLFLPHPSPIHSSQIIQNTHTRKTSEPLPSSANAEQP